MQPVAKEYRNNIAPLFAGWQETLIWSCLQGHMGKAWANDLHSPVSAQIITGDFCFLAGEPDRALARNMHSEFSAEALLVIPQHEGWCALLEEEYPGCEKILRYAIRKDTVFDKDLLRHYADSLPEAYTLKPMDKLLYDKANSEEWSQDFCRNFRDYHHFETAGMGFMALLGDVPVAGAASYTVYDRGIEIEVDTHTEHRRKGLALACCARLILECLQRGLYPSWDAHDLRSVALAEKLGYRLDKEYVTYVVAATHKASN